MMIDDHERPPLKTRNGLRRHGPAIGLVVLSLAAAWSIAAYVPSAPAADARVPRTTLRGTLLSGDRPLAWVPVTLYRSASRDGGAPVVLGASRTRADGTFEICYARRRPATAVIYLLA